MKTTTKLTMIAALVALAGCGSSNNQNNSADLNATTDMNAGMTDMNTTTTDMNASDLNAASNADLNSTSGNMSSNATVNNAM